MTEGKESKRRMGTLTSATDAPDPLGMIPHRPLTLDEL